MKVNVLIAGDTCPVGSNEAPFKEGNADLLVNGLSSYIDNADIFIANLECPLIKSESPIVKTGPVLGVASECAIGLKKIGLDIVSLANNHIMDHGEKGLLNTLDELEKQKIEWVGVGKNLAEARKILIKEINGLKIAFLSVTEHEFSIAGKNSIGASPLDIIDVFRNIKENKNQYDHLIVILHGGNENFQYPRKELVDTCRFLVENGAAAVLCQHSHCVGCYELYQGAPIIYGQGNFIFDYISNLPIWYEGCLVNLEFTDIGVEKVDLIPFKSEKSIPGVKKMDPEVASKWRSDLDKRSLSLNNFDELEAHWLEYCESRKLFYLHTIHGRPSFFRRVMGRLHLLHLLDSPAKQLDRLSLVQSESHLAVLKTILEQESKR